ncbi:MAG: N-acetylmuramoyl-L-alanine amidase [Deltaproteobacteria bacterium]|nr:N-acetylmuramoyl-L-alanine amidase [Deltaproteobacteria bacterium]
MDEREVTRIIVHCSDSPYGDARLIDKWHRERGFSKIGYHAVILNGVRRARYNRQFDGRIELGRDIDEVGAHVAGHNSNSLGVCLIGKPGHFTRAQIFTLLSYLKTYLAVYGLTPKDVYGHYEFDSNKTCPGFDMDKLRTLLVHLAYFYDQAAILGGAGGVNSR